MVELVVTDIMSKASDHRAHVLLLSERDGLRKIIVSLGFLEAQAIAFAMRGIKADRPLTHDLFGGVVSAFGIELQYVLINKVVDGTFCSLLCYRQGEVEHCIDSRTSDAIAIALRAGAPIYIKEVLLSQMCIRDEQNGAFSIPITAADEATLRVAIENAVKVENYELAHKLKEEINSRHAGQGNGCCENKGNDN
ncbi:MAG: bifunctional nuclease family protein [Bacteroidaceae bacterium]|jgi:bifunctional DNase/RNase|nr:bifunctional nuclease family protein [Bacteroidaceae bacterium]